MTIIEVPTASVAVEVNGAGATQAHAASKFRAGEVKLVAEVPEEGHIAIPVEFTVLPVHD